MNLQELQFETSRSQKLVIINNLVVPEASIVTRGPPDVQFLSLDSSMAVLKRLLGIKRKKHIVDEEEEIIVVQYDKKSVDSSDAEESEEEDDNRKVESFNITTEDFRKILEKAIQ
jgi:hypothetical protein